MDDALVYASAKETVIDVGIMVKKTGVCLAYCGESFFFLLLFVCFFCAKFTETVAFVGQVTRLDSNPSSLLGSAFKV